MTFSFGEYMVKIKKYLINRILVQLLCVGSSSPYESNRASPTGGRRPLSFKRDLMRLSLSLSRNRIISVHNATLFRVSTLSHISYASVTATCQHKHRTLYACLRYKHIPNIITVIYILQFILFYCQRCVNGVFHFLCRTTDVTIYRREGCSFNMTSWVNSSTNCIVNSH
jgi:hypothetical protein